MDRSRKLIAVIAGRRRAGGRHRRGHGCPEGHPGSDAAPSTEPDSPEEVPVTPETTPAPPPATPDTAPTITTTPDL